MYIRKYGTYFGDYGCFFVDLCDIVFIEFVVTDSAKHDGDIHNEISAIINGTFQHFAIHVHHPVWYGGGLCSHMVMETEPAYQCDGHPCREKGLVGP